MPCILVVDDRPTNRQFLSTLLAYARHRVIEAADGAEALRSVRAERPDLVITDILMPTMDGYEFVQKLRGEPAIAATPVIFYSAAFSVSEAQAMGATCGVRTILPKPSEPQTILDAVSRELGTEAMAGPAGPKDDPSQGLAAAAPPTSSLGESIDARLTDLRLARKLLSRTTGEKKVRKPRAASSESPSRRIEVSIRGLETISDRLTALEDLSLRLVSERRPEAMVELFSEGAAHIMGASEAAVCLLDAREKAVAHLVARGLDEDALRAAAVNPALLPGALLWTDAPLRLSAEGARSRGLPVALSAQGGFLGLSVKMGAKLHGWLFFLARERTDGFDDDDARIALSLAGHLAVVYENAQLYETVQRHAAQLQLTITERERATRDLKESEERFRQITEGIKEVFWLTNPAKNEMLYISPAYEQIWGRSRPALYSVPADWAAAIHPDDRERVLEAARTRQARGDYAEDYRIVRPDGSIRWIRDRAFPVRNAEGEVYRIAGVAEDVTEARWSARELTRMNRALTMLSHCNEALIRAVEEGALLKRVCELAVETGGYGVACVYFALNDPPKSLATQAYAVAPDREGTSDELAEVLFGPQRRWAADAPDGQWPAARAVRSGSVVLIRSQEDPTFEDVAGQIHWLGRGEGACLPLKDAERTFGVLALYSASEAISGDELRLLSELADDLAFGVLTIRTRGERVKAEEALRSSLKEKEALLKEVHHRVKNNLQVITSLLRLEGTRIEHDETQGVLKGMQNRIHSMAMLHETLYRTGDFAEVDLGSYLRQLSGPLVRSLVPSSHRVAIHLSLAPVHIGLDQAIPCGLIINELVTNALKYGFPEGRPGAVWIGLRETDEGDVVMSVRDNGQGLPRDFDVARSNSLGLLLVSDLARQLRGTLERVPAPEENSGAGFEVRFKAAASIRPGSGL